MIRFLARRLVLIPIVVAATHASAFFYAHLAQQAQRAMNPFRVVEASTPPLLSLYGAYVDRLLRGDFGTLPNPAQEPVLSAVLRAAGASLGLATIAFAVGAAAGIALGLGAVSDRPPRAATWLLPASSFALALPSFLIAAVGLAALTYAAIRSPEGALPLLPLQGFGWDLHLVLPVLALSLRPAFQTARVISGLLVDELQQLHIVAAHSRGIPWQIIRRRHALKNIIAPGILSIAGSLRLLAGELILVEWLFAWPGLGRLLAFTLLPPSTVSPAGFTGERVEFLHPELLALTLAVIAAFFLASDLVASIAARALDPRASAADPEFSDA